MAPPMRTAAPAWPRGIDPEDAMGDEMRDFKQRLDSVKVDAFEFLRIPGHVNKPFREIVNTDSGAM